MRPFFSLRSRGVMSEGMLCSAKELGLSDDHASIVVLTPDAPVGAPLATWLRAPGNSPASCASTA
jgi:hypothetical protein